MSMAENIDWRFWQPVDLFEEDLNLPEYARIRSGDELRLHGHPDDAIPIYDQVLEEAQHSSAHAMGASAAIHCAEAHRLLGDWESALGDYHRALERFHLLNQAHNTGMAYLMLGLCFQSLGKHTEAMHHFKLAHEQFDQLWRYHREHQNRTRAGSYRAWCEYSLLMNCQAESISKAKGSVLSTNTGSQTLPGSQAGGARIIGTQPDADSMSDSVAKGSIRIFRASN